MNSASDNPNKHNITVASFLDACKDDLQTELVAGLTGLNKRINESAMNRPGLALTGFFRYFANKRVQVIGLAENEYLLSLNEVTRRERLRAFFGQGIPCVVVTRGKRVVAELCELADEFKVPLLKSKMVTKNFINAAAMVCDNMMAPRMTTQGTMVEIMGIGVLIQGKHGSGKSETALSLIKRGFALVSDDVTALRLDSAGNVIGAPVNATRYHMEIRGIGIIHIPSLFGVASVREEKKLDLVVSLCEPGTHEEDRSGLTKDSIEILGVKIPRAYIPVAPGRDLSNVVETAALDEKLRRLGHDAAKELDETLIRSMKGSKDASE